MKFARVVAAVLFLALLAAWGATCALREPGGEVPRAGPSEPARPQPRRPRAPRPAAEEETPATPAPGAGPSSERDPAAPEPPAPRQKEDPAVRVRLRIVGADGLPAASAHVVVYLDPDAAPAGAEADAQGEITVRVRGRIAVVHAWSGDAGLVLSFVVPYSEPADAVEVRLLPGERVTGRALDERGLPVAGVLLRLALPLDFSGRLVRPRRLGGASGPESRAVVSCRAQDDGSFEFPPLPPESDTRLLADATGFEPFDAALATLPAERGRLRVDLVSQVVVHGRVKGPRGAAVTDFRVRLGERTAAPQFDAEGVFSVTGAPRSGGWLVIVPGRGTGLGPCEILLRPTRMPELHLGDVRLAAAADIDGDVVWPDGRPVESGVVEVRSRAFADGRAEVPIGPLGTFRVSGAGEALYTIHVLSAERALDPAPGVRGVTTIRASHGTALWRSGDGAVHITLDAVPVLVVRSVDAQGAAVPFDRDVRIEGPAAWSRDGAPAVLVDGARAAFVPTGRPPWRFRISDASRRAASVEIAGGWPVVERDVVLAPDAAK